MSDWKEVNDILTKDFKFSGFNQAVAFVNAVAQLANAANHHPDLLIHGYSNVEVRLSTHSAGGKITEKDYQLSKQIDALPKN
jgi:4a-hydroxytetrahydrobiopterin dehydratase